MCNRNGGYCAVVHCGRLHGGVVMATATNYVKGGEPICRLNCRWFDHIAWRQMAASIAPAEPTKCCKAALGGFTEDGHCPCHSHKGEE